MTDTINNKIPFVPENTIDPAAGLNLSLNTIDALLQVIVQTVGANTPPAGVEGQRHIVGTAPTGAWVGQANKLARFLDGAWQFFDARYALNAADGKIYIRSGSTWAVSASAAWGGITGTLSDQTDLQAALNGKQASNANLGALAGLTGAADRLPYFTGVGALSLATLTAFGRSLTAAADAAAGRTALALGNAATANITASAIDITAGRVMKTGDAGILGPTPGYLDGNALPNGVGFYAWHIESGVGSNYPLGQLDTWQGFESGGAIANRGFTIAGALGAGRVAFRTRTAGVNNAWFELWTSRGANAITLDIGSFGYGTGSGGTVTQATSKSTAVTLNKPSGEITLNNAALASNAVVSFTLTNNKISASDVPSVAIKSGATAGAYVAQVDAVAAGSCRISIRNLSTGSLSEAIVLSFVITKGATA